MCKWTIVYLISELIIKDGRCRVNMTAGQDTGMRIALLLKYRYSHIISERFQIRLAHYFTFTKTTKFMHAGE